MRKLLILSLTVLFCFMQFKANATFKVVGYMPSWSGSASNIQYSKLTHINYAFILPKADGSLQAMPNPTKLNTIVTNGHANGVKVLIAIGGWNIGAGDGVDTPFSSMASDPLKRKKFVDTVMSIVYYYNLDGVDMDWEYPNGSEAPHFTSLMTELSDTLHSVNKLLTMAAYAGGSGTVADDIADEVFEVIDFLNIMAYDYCCSGPHSSLNFGKSSLDYWTDIRGLDEDKAVLGVPFYGRTPYMSYNSIVSADATAAQRDYYISSNTIWYNGIPTMKSKVNYAKANGGGIMIWELSQDASGANSLLSAIYDITPVFTPVSNDFTMEIFPNPANDNIYVTSGITSGYATTKISVYDAMGVLVKEEFVNSDEVNMDIAELTPGVYILKLECGDQVSRSRFIKK